MENNQALLNAIATLLATIGPLSGAGKTEAVTTVVVKMLELVGKL